MKVIKLLLASFLAFSSLFAEEEPFNNLAFGVALFDTLDQNSHCISPYSIASALFIPYAGAEGDTKLQMSKTLNFPSPTPILADRFAQQNRMLTYHPSNYPESFHISIANSLWIQNDAKLLPQFLKIVQNELGATVRTTDFVKQTEASRDRINMWVNRETNGKIPELLAQGVIGPSTRMVVVSALYLKARWMNTFNSNYTRPQPFFATKTDTKTLPMMSQTETFGYFENSDYQALDLPLENPGAEGPNVSLIILLPRSEFNPTADDLAQLFSGLAPTRVKVSIPKFEIRDRMSVKDTLIKLGMEIPFTEEADFSGIMENQPLLISDVIHETYFNVAEDGIEAAAATAVVMMKTSMPVGEPKEFKADRPFIFILRENVSGEILFLGRYAGS